MAKGKATSLATAYVSIVPSMQGVGTAISKAFGDAATQAGRTAGGHAAESIGSAINAKAAAIMGAVSSVTSKAMSVIASGISGAIGRADQMNNFPKVMKNLGYSADDAAASIKKIGSSLDGLPTSSAAMSGMVQVLAPLTSSLDEATNIALALNDAMLAGGASTAEQENALEQYSQMLASGKVDAQAWLSVQNAMPGQLNTVAKSLLGATANSQDLYQAMKAGTVSFQDFNNAVVRLDKEGSGGVASFSQQAKDATQGIGTAMENARNRVQKAVQSVIEAFGTSDIANTINGVTSQFGKFGLAAAAVATAVKPMADQLGGTLVSGMQKAADWAGRLGDAASDVISILTTGDYTGGLMSLGIEEDSPVVSTLLDLRDAFGQVRDAAGQMVSALVSGLKYEIAPDEQGVSQLFMTLGSVMRDLTPVLQSAADWVGRFFHSLSTMDVLTSLESLVMNVSESLSGLATAFIDAIPPDTVAAAVTKLTEAFAWFTDNPALVTAGIDMIAGRLMFNGAMNGINGVVSGVGRLKGVIGGIASTAGTVGTTVAPALKGLVGILGKVGTAVRAVGMAMMANPMGLVIAGIAAVVAALVVFFTKTETGRRMWQQFTTWLTGVWEGIKQLASTVWTAIGDYISTVWEGIKQLASTVWTAIGDYISTVWEGVQAIAQNVCDFFTNAWNTIRTTTETVWNAIWGFLQPILTAMGEFFYDVGIVIAAVFVTLWRGVQSVTETVWNAITGFLQTVWDGIVAFMTPIVDGIRTTIGNMLNAVESAWDTAWNAISNVFNTIWTGIVAFVTLEINGMRNIIETVVNAVKTAWNAAWTFISTLFVSVWTRIVQFFTPIINGIRTTIGNALNAIQSTWHRVWDDVSGFFSRIWDGIRTTIGNALNAIQSTWHRVWDDVSGFFSRIWDGIKTTATNAINNVKDTVAGVKDKITSAFKDAGDWLKDAGRRIIDGLVGGIKDKFGKLKDTISNAASNTVSWAKGVLGINSPSRVFRDQVGRWIPEGMAVGITRNLSPVQQAMDTMGGLRPTGNVWTPEWQTAAVSGSWQPAANGAGGATGDDISRAIDKALARGVTLRLSTKGGEALAGVLAKPMNAQLGMLAAAGR